MIIMAMADEPIPEYVHFFVDESVKCLDIVHLFGEHLLLIGTTRGRCSLLSLCSNETVATLYEDNEKRQIVSVGQHRSNGDAPIFFVHIRAFAILLIKASKSRKGMSFEVVNKFVTSYYGFWGAVAYAYGCLMIPIENGQLKLLSADNENSESLIRFDSNEMKQHGTMTCFEMFSLNSIAVGFDSGHLILYDIQKMILLQEVKPYDKPILACAAYGRYLVISSVISPFKIFCLEDGRLMEFRSVMFPPSARGCGTLCFSPCGKQIASGYWNGTVRVHSLRSGNIRAIIKLHSTLISCLRWCSVEQKRLLFISSEDCKLSRWNLHKDKPTNNSHSS